MTSGRSDLVDIACELIHQTEKALLVHDGGKQVWVPKACAEFVAERGRFGTLTLPENVAHEKGLI